MGAGRRTETVTYNGHSTQAGGGAIKAAPQRKLAERGRLGSVIFGCTNATYNECVTHKIFGLPYAHHAYVDYIEPGMPLFLFNYTERKMHGIFEAMSKGALYISPYAWTGSDVGKTQYPAQVVVQLRTDFSRIVSLSESAFRETLIDSYHSPSHFFFEVDVEQTDRLIKLFERSAGGSYRPAVQKSPANAWQTVPPSKVWKKTNGSVETEDNLKLKKPATVVISEWESGAQYFPSSSKEVIPEDEVGAQQQAVWSRRSSHGDDYYSDESEDILKSPEVTSEAEMRRNTNNEKVEADHKHGKSAIGYRPKLGGSSDVQSSSAEGVHSDGTDAKKQSLTAAQEEESRRVFERLKVLANAPKETQPLQIQSAPVQQEAETSIINNHNNNSGITEWEKFSRERSVQEQALLWEEREKLGATLSDLDSSIAVTVKNNLELYAKAIEQMREDGMELRRLLDEARMRPQREESERLHAMEKTQAMLIAEIQALKLELVDVRRLSAKSNPQQKPDYGHENGGTQLIALDPPDNPTPPDIYLIGGLGDRLSRLESVMVWSPATDRLRTAAPMLTPRCCAGACVLDGSIFVFGGGDGTSWYDTVEKYDRREDQWMACAPMKTKRGSLGGVTVGDRIYAVGGGNGHVSFSEVESYDPYLGSWVPSPSMFDKRFCVAATELGGALYALGGFDGEQYLMSMERFDPREPLWSRMPPMSVKRGSLSAAVLNGRIYALGGYDGDGILDAVETYDVRAGRWDVAHQMCCQRAYGAVAVVGEALYYMGGLAEDEAVDSEQRSTEIMNGTHEVDAVHNRGDLGFEGGKLVPCGHCHDYLNPDRWESCEAGCPLTRACGTRDSKGGYRSWRSQWQASWQHYTLGTSVPGLSINSSYQIQRFTEATGWQSMRPRVTGKRSCLAAVVF